MRQLTRLVRYALPYWWQILSSVLLLAAVGGLDAFKYPAGWPGLRSGTKSRDRIGNIQAYLTIPSHAPSRLPAVVSFLRIFTNAWTIVAFALVASTIFKGICDYCRNLPGESRRLRHDHRSARSISTHALLRRSAAFFPSTPPELCSPPSSTTSSACNMPCRRVLAEFLQQFFTFFFMARLWS